MLDQPMTTPGYVDTHQHFWRYHAIDYPWIDDRLPSLKRDRLPADVKPSMARAGFTTAIAVQARQTLEETTTLLALADQHPWIAGVVGWVDLCADDVERQLAMLAHPKLVGIRHVVQDEADDRFLLRPDFGRGVSLLESFGLTYDILIFPRHLPVAADFLSRFPTQRFVLDHLAKPEIRLGKLNRWARDLESVAAHPNVVAKLSGLVTEASWDNWTPVDLSPCLDVAVGAFGVDRLMVGSDWPVCTVAASYERTMHVFTEYLGARPAAERAAVLGGNARRFWRLGGETQ